MLLSKYVDVTINSRTYQYYQSMGYDVRSVGQVIQVNYRHLKRYSEVMLTVQCDFCNRVFQRHASDHFAIHQCDNNDCDACYHCRAQKQKQTIMHQYGVSSIFSVPLVQDKCKQTLRVKYGVDNPSQIDGIQQTIREHNMAKYGVAYPQQLTACKEKVRATNRQRYNVDYYQQTDEYVARRKQTCLQKYGTESPCSSEVVKEKIKHTLMEKYGVDNPTKNADILRKSMATRYQHGNQTCSCQQYALYEIIGGELNYPVGSFYVDIALLDDHIAIEYNGSGHDLSVRLGRVSPTKFVRNENYRKKYLYKNGWLLITFITKKDVVPTRSEVLHMLDFAKQTFANGRHWIEFDLDGRTYTNSTGTNEYNITSLND